MARRPEFLTNVTNALHALRNADFLTRQRIVRWSTALLIGFGVALAFMALTARGLNDYHGRPLGSDFSNIYAAGTWVREGKPTAAFDIVQQYRKEQAIFGHKTPTFGWHYPPYFLAVAAPLAALPYVPALLIWQLSTLLLYLLGIRALLRRIAPAIAVDRLWILLAVAFPAAFVNLIHGHNGFLTAALISGGLAFLDAQPILAGVLFGLLAYKPQFFAVVPIVLLASGRWRVFVSTMATLIALTAAVTAVFGPEVWSAFLASTHFTRTVVLEQGSTGFNKIQSVFAWVRLWGGSIPLAYAVQGTVSMTAAVLVVLFWRKPASFADRTAALCLAAMLATPYCLDYDMTVLAPAIALLAAQGIEQGFRPWEKCTLASLWVVPIMARELAASTLIPLGVWTMLGLAALIAKSTLGDSAVRLLAIGRGDRPNGSVRQAQAAVSQR